MVCTPSQPGGIRMSTKATAYGRSRSTASRTFAAPSSHCIAESIS